MNRVQRAIVAALTVAAFNLSISSAVMAQSTVYTDGLTESQRAQVELEVAKMKEAPKDTVNVSEGVRKEAEEWGQLGSNMGKAISCLVSHATCLPVYRQSCHLRFSP